MRYIRTKDGKIHDSKKCGDLVHTSLGYVTGLGTVMIKEKDIVDRSDDLAYLCDRFVGIEENGTPHIFACECDLLDLIHNMERRFGTKITGYGSIWIDGDLIKVAKLNEEGELELL